MKNRFLTVLLLLVFLVTLTGNAQATTPPTADRPALVFVSLASPDDMSRFASTRLPMYTMLDKGLLTGADRAGQQMLLDAGLSIQVLDPDLRSGSYYVATMPSSRPAPDFTAYGSVLHNIGPSVLLRMDPLQVDALTHAGAELRWITLTPKPLPAAEAEQVIPSQIEPDPMIQSMIDQVSETQVYTYDRQLAGELPVWVDGEWYTITSRYTYSGIPIQKATSFVGQHLASEPGMEVEYHVWEDDTYPNVIGQITGLTNPDEIYIIGGHLDDVSGSPGADDNASGPVAALLAADIFSQYKWGCTLRFAFWTGEEQGLLGSYEYAQRAYQNGENILGYLNLDMIAWNTINSPMGLDLIYNPNMPPTEDLANLYADVISAYNLDLVPDLRSDLGGGSDHSSFWEFGYTSILAIEDQADFNPYYHSSQDTPAHTDPAFFTQTVKASLATFAHMTGCLIPGGIGSLNGHVTAETGGAPIDGATVVAENGEGHKFSTTTDASGFYSRTLMADTYTVTASAYSYVPVTETNVVVVTDTITTQDFALPSLPTYIVSGHVYDSVSGDPLVADVQFTDAPVPPFHTGPDGFYSLEVAQGSWHLNAKSASHLPQTKPVEVNGDVVEDFYLDPLPCILLVDDDGNDPDVRDDYTSALDNIGYEYNIWDVNSQGDPSEEDVLGYQQVMWFTGYPYNDTFNSSNEAVVGAYLDAGGNFFLSSQDYLYNMGLTDFGENYLHILNYVNDQEQTTVTGQNVYDGLGPYSLVYPFINYSDVVNPDGQALVAFDGNIGNAAISYDGASFNSVFFGYPFEAIQGLADRTNVMGQTIDFFEGCGGLRLGPDEQTKIGELGSQVSYTYVVTNEATVEQAVTLSVEAVWPTEVPVTVGVLAPGASATVPVTVTIPLAPDVIIDEDTFILTASGETGIPVTALGTTKANVNPGVGLAAPQGSIGEPLQEISYTFVLTNTGDYTDLFTLEISGVWTATLPGGENTGLLPAGAITTITVVVTVPGDVVDGAVDVTTLMVASDLDQTVAASAEVTTTASVPFKPMVTLLPIVRK